MMSLYAYLLLYRPYPFKFNGKSERNDHKDIYNLSGSILCFMLCDLDDQICSQFVW